VPTDGSIGVRRGRVMALAVLLVLCCAAGTAAQEARRRVYSASAHARARPRRSRSGLWSVGPGSVGPFDLGMTAAAIRRQASRYGLRIRRGRGDDLLLLTARGHSLLRIAIERGAVDDIVVSDPRFHTAEGARVGTRLWTLARLYGRGYIEPSRPPTAYFGDADPKRAFGIDFEFKRPGRLQLHPDTPNGAVASEATWRQLLRLNPPVIAIIAGGA
jgi:hypothetical protein